jgi:zinc protease
MAAELSGFVGREQTVFVARVHHDHLVAFYPLLRDVLLAPSFDDGDVDRVRTRAVASLTQDLRGGDDEELGKQTLQAMLFEGDGREHPELGTEQGLSSIRAEDVADHWARLLCASRLTVALSGAVDDGFVRTLQQDLGKLQRPSCAVDLPRTAAPSRSTHQRVWLVDKPEAKSVAISLGMPLSVTRSHPDYAALTLAAAYFGQHRTFSGRLMQKMRELRGLNYGDYAYAEHFEQDGDTRFPRPNVARRSQYFSVWLRPVPVEKAQFALRMALRELKALISEGLSAEDFARTQRFADRYYALYAQTEQQRLGNALDERFYGTSGPHLDTLRAAFRALTREQVNAAIARNLSLGNLQIALVAPQAEKLAEALIKGGPSAISYASEKPAAVLEEDKQIGVFPLGISREQVRIVPVASLFAGSTSPSAP